METPEKKYFQIAGGAIATSILSNTVFVEKDKITKGLIEIGIGVFAQLFKNYDIKNIGKGVMMAGATDLLIGSGKKILNRRSIFRGIIVKNLPAHQHNIFNNTIYLIAKQNDYFAYLYLKLANSGYPFEITFGERRQLGETYIADFQPFYYEKGGSIDIRHISALQYFSDDVESSIVSEFFRAYQLLYYVYKHNYVSGIEEFTTNADFEVKFFNLLVSIKKNKVVSKPEDLQGFSDEYLLSLITAKSSKFTRAEIEPYFVALRYYCEYHKIPENSMRKVLPLAALKILRSVNI